MGTSNALGCRPGCVHLGRAMGCDVCWYCANTGHSRPCPPGPDCIVWSDREEDATMEPTWDVAKSCELYVMGCTYAQVAQAL